MVDEEMLLEKYLDRKGVALDFLIADRRLGGEQRIRDLVGMRGWKIHIIGGIPYVLKNNSQGDRIRADVRAYEFFVRSVRVGAILDLVSLRQRCRAAGVKWDALQRIFREQGVYLLAEDVNGVAVWRAERVGFEMDPDKRIRTLRGLVDIGYDIATLDGYPEVRKSVFNMLYDADPMDLLTEREFQICLELYRSITTFGKGELGE